MGDVTPSNEPKPSRWRFRFGLIDLLAAAGTCCLVFAMIAWGGDALGLGPEFYLALGIGLLVVGILARRTWPVAAGVVVLIGLWIGVTFYTEPTSPPVVLSGWRKCDLPVRIVDATTGESVPVASVRVVATLEGETRTSSGHSDDSGFLEVACSVPGYSPVGLTGEAGFAEGDYITLEAIRVQVEAEGYTQTVIALDKHFGQPRWDFRDGGLTMSGSISYSPRY